MKLGNMKQWNQERVVKVWNLLSFKYVCVFGGERAWRSGEDSIALCPNTQHYIFPVKGDP